MNISKGSNRNRTLFIICLVFFIFGPFLCPGAYGDETAPELAITSVSPDHGSTMGGATITVTGSGFTPDTTVKVGNHWAQTVTYDSSTQLTVVTPASQSIGPVDIMVKNPDGKSATLKDAFTYIVTPTISNITPNYGVPGEDRTTKPVVIYGTNFDENVTVYFGGVKVEAAFITRVSPYEIQVKHLPNQTPGTVDVKVENSTGEGFTLYSGFTFKAEKSVPSINDITPNTGSTEETTRVTITGEQLLTGAQLFIGEAEVSLADAVFTSTSEVHVDIPPSAVAGQKDVTWVNEDGGTVTLKNGFTHVRPEDAVKITSVTPDKGAVDQKTLITITGLNFVDPRIQGNSLKVTIGGVEAVYLEYVDSRTLIARTPLGYVKEGETETAWDVTVSQSFTRDGKNISQSDTLKNGFTYVIPGSKPTVYQVYDRKIFRRDKIITNAGPLAGGNEVVIIGTDFRTQDTVMPTVEFGKNITWNQAQVVQVIALPNEPDYDEGLPAYEKGVAEVAIIAVAPAGTATGSVDVHVVNPDFGAVTKLNGWIYETGNLTVTDVTPNTGPITGGIEVVISGANFMEDDSLWVEFRHNYPDGSVKVTPVKDYGERQDTWIKIMLPPSIPGVKDVVVYDRFGESILKDAFTYLSLSSVPVIQAVYSLDEDSNLLPPQVASSGGDKIVIYGQDFRVDSSVTIGGQSAQVADAKWNVLTVITPPGTPGWQEVVVTNPDGAFVVKKEGVKYVSYPLVRSVTPNVVNSAGGAIVTISGDQFYPGAKVYLKKAEAASEITFVKVADLNTIYTQVPKGMETGDYDVIVRNTDYDSGTGMGEGVLAEGITLKESSVVLPVVKSITPNRGPVSGGISAVVICGNAQPDANIYIGLEEARITGYLGENQMGEDQFSIIIPPNEEGDYYVTVTNPDGGTGVSDTEIFEYRLSATNMEITSINPGTGSTKGGTYVTIRGTGFRTGAEVFFGSNKADNVIVALEDPVTGAYRISCYTPPGSMGFVDVSVVNPDTAFGIAVAEDGFEYRNPASEPDITSIVPDSGSTAGGTKITIKGTDFRAGVNVYLDGIPASHIVLVDSRNVTAVTPPHKAGQTAVTVINYDGGSSTFGDAEGEAGFTYVIPGSFPEVDTVEPGFGPAGKTTWTTITGLDFRVNPKVYFGAVEATEVEYKDYQTLRALAPAQKAGKVDVTVVNEDFGTGTLENGFTYRSSSPSITAINPAFGNFRGGDTVTIIGADFVVEYLGDKLSVAPAVYFEQGTLTVQAEVLPGSAGESLIIRTPGAPEGIIGFYDVRVVNSDGAQAVLKKGFKYTVPDSNPVITSIDPSSGSVSGGTPVKITGTDFRDDALVFIGGKEATKIRVVSSTVIMAITPSHSPGTKDVTVVNYDGGSFTLENGFTYSTPLSEPVIASVSPASGPQSGGTAIVITGRDFREGCKAYIGGELCTDIVLVDYKTITAVTPPGEEGSVDVTVINADMGLAVLKNGFKFIMVDLPVISGITPSKGISEGGTEITIKGNSFAKGLSVAIGGAKAEVINVTESQIKAVTPPGAIGPQDVVVTNPDGGRAVLKNGFEYTKPRTAPDTPGSLEASAVDKTTVKLEWGDVDFANYFEIYVREKGEDTYRFVDQTKSDVNVYYVTGLQPGTTYYFQVRAVNEKGLSGFTATDSAKTKSGSNRSDTDEEREEREDNVQVILGQGTRTLTVSSKTALRECNYTFDFSDEVSRKNPVSIVQLNADVAEDVQQEVVVKLTGCEISVPASVLNLPEINSLSGKEKKEAVVRIIITDAGQREAENALESLPYGAKVISKIYSLQLEVISRGKSADVDLFSHPVGVTFQLPASGSRLRNIGVYSRNLNGRWARASGSSVSYSLARAYTYFPTTFLLAGF